MSEIGLFFREFLRSYHTTGAILPSGKALGKALARYVAEPAAAPRRILEVGPGTGAVTRRILAVMQPHDTLDLVELNDQFVRLLEQLLRTEPLFQAAASRIQIHHAAVEDLAAPPFDLIISGLPLNNFSVEQVEQILGKLLSLLKPGGTLSFFEYIFIRRVKALVTRRADRRRLRGIARAMQAALNGREIRRDAVWRNVPPAWVHHLRSSEG